MRHATGAQLNVTRILLACDGLGDSFVATTGESDLALVQPLGGIKYDIGRSSSAGRACESLPRLLFGLEPFAFKLPSVALQPGRQVVTRCPPSY